MLALLWWLENYPHVKGGSAWAKGETPFINVLVAKKSCPFLYYNFLKSIVIWLRIHY